MIAIRWSAKVNMLAPRWLMTVLHNRTWWGDWCPHSSSDWTSSKHITPWSRSRFDDVQSLHVYWKKTPRALDFNLHSTLLIRRVQIKFNVLKSNVRVFFSIYDYYSYIIFCSVAKYNITQKDNIQFSIILAYRCCKYV